MSKLIKNGHVVSDEWKALTLADGETPQRVKLPVGPLLVPLSVWQARRAELIHREYEHGWPLGIWLAAGESAEAIERDVDDFTVIAIELNKLAADRSFERARLLRERYGYRGELRAIGAVSRDDLVQLHQTGFDAVAISDDAASGDTNVWAGLAELLDFSGTVLPGQRLAGATA